MQEQAQPSRTLLIIKNFPDDQEQFNWSGLVVINPVQVSFRLLIFSSSSSVASKTKNKKLPPSQWQHPKMSISSTATTITHSACQKTGPNTTCVRGTPKWWVGSHISNHETQYLLRSMPHFQPLVTFADMVISTELLGTTTTVGTKGTTKRRPCRFIQKCKTSFSQVYLRFPQFVREEFRC